MAASVSSGANHRMIEWARKKAGYSQSDIAAALKVDVDSVTEWESGTSSPTLAVLRQLAKHYHRPLIVFYLPEPPRDFSVVKDFRFLPASADKEFSPELRRAIRRAQERQEWAASYLEDIGASKCELVASLKVATPNVCDAAANLRQHLGVRLEDQFQSQHDSAAFGLWKKAVEALGVFVFQIGGISVEDMRGFALSNPFAPIVVVNGSDYYTAKTFTLVHEMAHILLGVSAVYGGRPTMNEPQDRIERFCNRVAANVLVPRDDFLSHIPSDWKSRDDIVISEMARRYRVSRLVIGQRLVETELADKEYLSNKWPSLQSRPQKKKEGPIAIPQHVLTTARVGESFTRLSLAAYYANDIHGGDLTELLGMKLKHLPKLESQVYPNRIRPLLKAE